MAGTAAETCTLYVRVTARRTRWSPLCPPAPSDDGLRQRTHYASAARDAALDLCAACPPACASPLTARTHRPRVRHKLRGDAVRHRRPSRLQRGARVRQPRAHVTNARLGRTASTAAAAARHAPSPPPCRVCGSRSARTCPPASSRTGCAHGRLSAPLTRCAQLTNGTSYALWNATTRNIYAVMSPSNASAC